MRGLCVLPPRNLGHLRAPSFTEARIEVVAAVLVDPDGDAAERASAKVGKNLGKLPTALAFGG